MADDDHALFLHQGGGAWAVGERVLIDDHFHEY